MDNGAYEGELVTFDELCKVATELKPQVLTIPDKINDMEASRKLMEDFMSECKMHLPKDIQFMRVFQSESRNPILWQEMIGEETYGRDWEWIALPRVLGADRPAIAKAALDALAITNTKVHAFGWTGNLNEVRVLAKLGVTSIDTSAPVWRGLACHHLLDEVDEAWETQGSKFDPSYPYSIDPDEHSTIQSNLQSMLRACVAF